MVDLADRNTTAADAGAVPPARRGVPRWLVTVASIIVILIFGEIFGRDINPIFGSYPSAIFEAFLTLCATASSLWRWGKASSRSCSAMA
ncbi:MAG: hypothetical protein WBE82_08515 [Xanthobacteraceae bacterium]